MSAKVDRLLRKREVAPWIGLTIRGLYNLCRKDPKFPKPRKVGGSLRWLESEVAAYIKALPKVMPAAAVPYVQPKQRRRRAVASA